MGILILLCLPLIAEPVQIVWPSSKDAASYVVRWEKNEVITIETNIMAELEIGRTYDISVISVSDLGLDSRTSEVKYFMEPDLIVLGATNVMGPWREVWRVRMNNPVMFYRFTNNLP
jgi:hypothetical protein